MIAVDTNILARLYVDDRSDPEAHRQRPIALRVMTGSSIFVPASVLLELECVLRALYEFGASDFADVVNHLRRVDRPRPSEPHSPDQPIFTAVPLTETIIIPLVSPSTS